MGRGTAIDPGGFASEPRKMWLYVGKAGSRTDREMLERYVKDKLGLGDDELTVEALRTVGISKSYKVGVDSRYYDQVNKPEFWPQGILFRRFKFGSAQSSVSSPSFPEAGLVDAGR